MSNFRKFRARARFQALVLAVLCGIVAAPAHAHNGPPFPIVEKRRVGPFVIDLWTHPDLGYGTFFVIVDAAPGMKIPADLEARIAVEPETGRLPEKMYVMWRDPVRNQVQFDNNRIEFDQQEFWRVRLVLDSSAGRWELLSRVEPTPTGLGKWDLVLYALPFAFVAFMWQRGMARRKKLMQRYAARTSTGEANSSEADLRGNRGGSPAPAK
ncbi:MAG: hypothetical protein J2P13_05625 [Acidobacteria bacterium]|nr:hypothetical protein [Acidobacteriota bacterium]